MSIVRMKRMRLLALRDDKQAIMHRLMRLGCVEISEPDARLGRRAVGRAGRSGAVGSARAQNRAEYPAGRPRNTLLEIRAVPKKAFSPCVPAVKESEFYSQETLDKTMESAERINFISQEIAQVYAGIGRENNRISALDPWKQLECSIGNHLKRALPHAFRRVPRSLLSWSRLRRHAL